MKPRPVRRVLNGKTYNTERAILLADSEVPEEEDEALWQPRPQVAKFLYRTERGEFMVVFQHRQRPDRDRLVPINREAALELYRSLPVHHWDEQHAFHNIWVPL